MNKNRCGGRLRILLLAGACLVLYNEHLVYVVQSWGWARVSCEGAVCARLVLVADPQILGERSARPPLRWLFDWDSDRFLIKTYGRLVGTLAPDAVVFLGDVMDEGAVSSDSEFRGYVERLSSIFPTEYPVKHIWLPGDNDIGGENEPVYPQKVRRFSETFSQPDVIGVKSVDVYKLNLITKQYPASSSLPANRTRIAVSHMPLSASLGPFAESLLRKIRPHAIFSAHKHTAFHLETAPEASFVTRMMAITPRDADRVIRVDFEDRYHEFIVPTCSYRMGVPDVGYGVAFVDRKGLQYSVFWSPRRFDQLKYYVMYLVIVLLYFIVKICFSISLKRCSIYTIKNDYSKV